MAVRSEFIAPGSPFPLVPAQRLGLAQQHHGSGRYFQVDTAIGAP